MKNAYDFFEKWILENENNILGKQVNEIYYGYCHQAFAAGYRHYSKKSFIEEVNFRLECTTREIFVKNEDVYCIK